MFFKKKRAIFAGSFDPLHAGHIDIIKRASKLFDQLYIAVSYNTSKQNDPTLNKRYLKVLNNKVIKTLKNVKVIKNSGLTIDLCKKLKCKYLIRSVRNLKDYGYELTIAQTNHYINDSIETIFFIASEKLKNLSSSQIRLAKKEISYAKQLKGN